MMRAPSQPLKLLQHLRECHVGQVVAGCELVCVCVCRMCVCVKSNTVIYNRCIESPKIRNPDGPDGPDFKA